MIFHLKLRRKFSRWASLKEFEYALNRVELVFVVYGRKKSARNATAIN